jgi:hypothetical protein
LTAFSRQFSHNYLSPSLPSIPRRCFSNLEFFEIGSSAPGKEKAPFKRGFSALPDFLKRCNGGGGGN